MKKLLFCAGVLALMASCAKYDVDSVAVEKSGKGIVFEATAADDATRGGFDETATSYVPRWYAEQDQIQIWADNAIIGVPGATTPAVTTVGFDANGLAYKATQSERDGKFTSTVYNQTWNFNREGVKMNGVEDATMSNFFAFYPAPTTENKYTVVHSGTDGADVFTVTIEENVLKAQTQTDAKGAGVYDHNIKWSVSHGEPVNSYDAVGEKVNLDFSNRELAGFVFSTKGVKKEYNFGALKTVELTARGYVAEANVKEYEKDPDQYTYNADKGDIEPSLLNYGEGATMQVTLKYSGSKKADKVIDTAEGKTTVLTAEEGEGDNSNSVDVSALKTWNDTYKAYMLVKPIDHTEFAEAGVKETFDIVYTFENITFKVDRQASSGIAAGGFADLYNLDIAAYDYLVVNGQSTNDKTLIVFKYDAAKMFDKDVTSVMWNGEKVALANFATIISEAAWGADLTKIAKFTNLTSLTLNADTTLPKDMLKGIAANLTKFVAPEVVEVNAAFTNNVAFAKVTELNMASYTFPEDAINAYFFNDTEKGVLQKLDISGVEDMFPTFNEKRTLTFTDYKVLEEVTVPDGIVVTPAAFKGCVSLETINGTIDLSQAESAFEMPSAGNHALESVAITNNNIPAMAFKNCKVLEDVTNGDATVVPVSVGKEAFWGCPAISYMDLSQTTEIGEKAFEFATGFQGAEEGNKLLTVGAAKVGANAFANTKVVNVDFVNVATLNPGIFEGVSTLAQVRFKKKFEVYKKDDDAGTWTNTFGKTPANVDLFVVAAQDYVNGSYELLLPVKSNKTDKITFKIIKKE